MIDEKSYNGWTNYETWRVNLEVFDGFYLQEKMVETSSIFEIGEYLKQAAKEIVVGEAKGLVAAFAVAFMQNVNWSEIAEGLMKPRGQ